MKEDILIVDDSLDMLEVLRRQLSDLSYSTFQATNAIDAIDVLKVNLPNLLITDIKMPGVDGLQLVKYVSEHYPQLPILVITGYPSVENAVDVLKRGAIDYLIKPFTKDELETAVQKVFSSHSPSPKVEKKPEAPKKIESKNPIQIVGNSKALDKTTHLINRTKDNKVTVLITGESGTGKELVARAIHYGGKFSKAPFIAVNCGAIPENLLESELFGYLKGSFTGAENDRTGFFQAADGGTIFLDEIGNASLQVQQRLLRVIQEKEVSMIGAQLPQKIDVRIIAATNSDLLALSKSGEFREDLYYRLNVVNIEVPPLRDRKEDIPELARFFLKKHGHELQKESIKITPEAKELLMDYYWPGNIRELENILHHSLIMADNEIDVQHLPDSIKNSSPKKLGNKESFKTLKEIEEEYIHQVLKEVGNNKTKAAEILGITRKTLRSKL